MSDGQFTTAIIGTITMAGVDDPPFLAVAEVVTDEDTSIDFGTAVNEFDNDDYLITMVVGPVSGTVEQLDRNLFRYTPEADYFGNQVLQFKIQDLGTANTYESVSADLRLNTTAVNDPPVATPPSDAQTLEEDTSLDVVIPMTDVDNDVSELSVLNGPSDQGGTCGFISADPVIMRYTPAVNYSGPDLCPFYPTDGQDLGIVKAVTFNVTPLPDAPTANFMDVRVSDTLGYSFTLNVGDPDEDPLTVDIISDVSDGSLSLDGLVATYTPNGPDVYSDSFSYRVSDGALKYGSLGLDYCR